MATVREGNKAAILVVDVQNGVVQKAHDRDAVVNNIRLVVEKGRAGGISILFIQHSGPDLPENSPDWQIVPELTVNPSDKRLGKKFNSSFEDTDLEKTLKQWGITEVVLTGAATNWCVRATAFGALAKGYDVTLVSDAHTTEDMPISQEKTLYAKDLILELNIGIKYIEYPGVTTLVIKAADIAFPAN